MIPTGPVTPKEVRDLLKVGLKSPEFLHPDFPATGELSGGVESQTRGYSTVGMTLTSNQASGPRGCEDEEGENKLSRLNRPSYVARESHSGSSAPPAQYLSEIDVACDGQGNLFDEIGREMFGK